MDSGSQNLLTYHLLALYPHLYAVGQKQKENTEETHLCFKSLGPDITHITSMHTVLEKIISQPHIRVEEAERFCFFACSMKRKTILMAAISSH